MKGRTAIRVWSTMAMALSLGLSVGSATATDLPAIPPETVADYIHSVIEADRTFYTIHVVERLQKHGKTAAAENWRAKKNVLPLPAQFLMQPLSPWVSNFILGLSYLALSRWLGR